MAAKKRRAKRYRLIFCLILSLLCWFAVKMSKNYTQTYRFGIEFVNTPINKFLYYQSDTTISVTIDGKGISLLKYELGKKQIKIDYASVATSEQKRNNNITIKRKQLNTYLIKHLDFPEHSIINEPLQINLKFDGKK
jgi:hypothetical protein